MTQSSQAASNGTRAPILPRPDVWAKPFWSFADRGQLALQRCSSCRSYRYPPGPVCPKCRSGSFGWEPVSGHGRVISWVVFHQNYYPGTLFEVPYNVAMVALDEGVNLIGNLTEAGDESVRIGLEVEAVFVPISDEVKLLQFRPAPKRAAQ